MQEHISHVGIVGSGAMGRGIAQVCVTSGLRVTLVDSNQAVVQSAHTAIVDAIRQEVAKGRLEPDLAESAIGGLATADTLAGLASSQLVIEAITEDLGAKRALFGELEQHVAPDCILASNTSSLSITTLAAACKNPRRVAGMHFFNPVPRMKLVEVIKGLKTDDAVIDRLEQLGRAIGKEVVRVQDTPGFLVNQVGRGYTLEAVNIVGEGVASYEQVDRVMREAAGFRMGPFELLDLVGLDVNHPATEMIYSQFYQEPRYRPSPLMDTRVSAGLLGRKAKEGYYTYADKAAGASSNGAQQATAGAAAASGSQSVWVSDAIPELGQRVRDLLKAFPAILETGQAPGKDALCIVTPVGRDASHAAAHEGLDPARTIAVDALFGLSTHRTLMSTCATDPAWKAAAVQLFESDGTPVTLIRDSPGFIAQRIVAMIMNIGAALAQGRIALPKDIDRAVTLGLAYPQGPLAFANLMGADHVQRLLSGLYESHGDPRYRPALWLKRRAALKLDFHHGD